MILLLAAHSVCQEPQIFLSGNRYPLNFHADGFGLQPASISDKQGRTNMQELMTLLTVVAGLVFSVAIAVVVEELIFGRIFQLFFKPGPKTAPHPAWAWVAAPVKLKSGQRS
jgi:hypothetical protein